MQLTCAPSRYGALTQRLPVLHCGGVMVVERGPWAAPREEGIKELRIGTEGERGVKMLFACGMSAHEQAKRMNERNNGDGMMQRVYCTQCSASRKPCMAGCADSRLPIRLIINAAGNIPHHPPRHHPCPSTRASAVAVAVAV